MNLHRRPAPSAWRRGFHALVALVVLMIVFPFVWKYIRPATSWERDRIPLKVASADDLARRAVPGWRRAEAANLVVPLGVDIPIPDSEIRLTLEKGWFSGRETYLLYTVKAPPGKHVMPTWVILGEGDNRQVGQTDWIRLRQWGGFSPDGFHSVIVFPSFARPPADGPLPLEFRQWAYVSEKTGMQETGPSPVIPWFPAQLPWKAAYLAEPAPEQHLLNREGAWLGRTLRLETLSVGTGRMILSGKVHLPEGERDPAVSVLLRVGKAEREPQSYRQEPAGEPGWYRFTAIYDGPDTWPARVQAEIRAIGFRTDQTLEWPFPWAEYRGQAEPAKLPPDQVVSHKFYDSTLRTLYVYAEGVGIEVLEPEGKPPFVRGNLSSGGRGRAPGNRGMELAGPGGAVETDFGGSSGVIYDGRRNGSGKNLDGVSVRWGPERLPDSFKTADRLTLRYVYPDAALVVGETWTLIK